MWVEGVTRGLLVILTILPLRSEGIPAHQDGQACVLTDKEDLVEAFDNVQNIRDCRQLCTETKDCNFFNYFTPYRGPYKMTCYLLRSCSQTVSLKFSETGATIEDSTCSLPVEPTDAQIIRNYFAASELDCKKFCKEEDNCTLYSYFETLNDCQLLRGAETFQDATMKNFYTGPPDCVSESGQCTFALLGQTDHVYYNRPKVHSATHAMVDHPKGGQTITLISAVRHCNVTLQIVIIGEGGKKGKITDKNVGWNSGGGSGYINSTTVAVHPNVDIAAKFSYHKNEGKNSVGIIWPPGQYGFSGIGNLVAWAENGESGTEQKGGDGYSGGGYPYKNSSCSDGGMDGGNGSGDHPGMGSKLDVSLFNMPYFNFTAGTFGMGSSYSADYSGGGGGILVNGKGPRPEDYGKQYAANGYGAGEGYIAESNKGIFLFAIINP